MKERKPKESKDPFQSDLLPGHWVHSREEDTATQVVYRPATFKLPPSRGREAFDLRADGSLVTFAIGPTDRREPSAGSWQLEGSGSVVFYGADSKKPARVLEIQALEKDRLVAKK